MLSAGDPKKSSRISTKTVSTERRRRNRSGQSLVESTLFIVLICLIFFGVFQLSQLTAARQVLQYAAFAAARSRAVGYNRWIVDKALHVSAIPLAGAMRAPETDLRPREQLRAEISAIPAYLQAYYPGEALHQVLDYEEWDGLDFTISGDRGALLRMSVRARYPLRLPMHRAFYAADEVTLRATNVLDNHYPVYLDVD